MDPVFSYMLPAYRAYYASRLLSELARKASGPYEVLIWLNVHDEGLDRYIQSLISSGYPMRVVGKTPENIGMAAFRPLVEQSRGAYLVQVEDDVLCLSHNAGAIAREIMERRPEVGMISADVWQDEISNGGHPTAEAYRKIDDGDQLYEGPIDGGFSVYPRKYLHLLMGASFRKYFGFGCGMHERLMQAGLKAYKCRRMRIFHLMGPEYASYFPGMLDFEIAKYAAVGHTKMVGLYESSRSRLPDREFLRRRLKAIENFHNSFYG